MKQAQPRGRPTRKTPEVVDAICASLGKGETLTSVCTRLGLDRTAVWDWTQNDQSFYQRYARAREIGHDTIADETLAIADNTEEDSRSRRVRADVRIRLLEKWDRRYAARQSVELSGPNGGPIQLRQTDDQMIAQLVAVTGQNPMVKHKLKEALKAALAALE